MNKQPEMVTALYYRAARKNDDTNLYLDNQMYQLLHYAQQHGIDSYILYADNGFSGTNPDRPSFQKLQAHIPDQRIHTVVVSSIDRLSRNMLDTLQFMENAAKYGASVISITEGSDLLAGCNIYSTLVRSFEKGGEQK